MTDDRAVRLAPDVARLTAERDAAEAKVERAKAVVRWLAAKEADWAASYRSGGGQYAEGARDVCDVAEDRLRTALGGS